MKKEFTNIPESGLEVVAKEWLQLYPDHRVFALYGEMGAGKTTFIRHICQLLKVTDSPSSPTFALIHSYSSQTNGMVHHFDCYRLKNAKEIQEIGYEDYLYSGEYCFIEWPEIIESLLPPETVKITIVTGSDPTLRNITFS